VGVKVWGFYYFLISDFLTGFTKEPNLFLGHDIKRGTMVKRLVIVISVILMGTLFSPSSPLAVHKGAGDLVCGQCHTMHTSQGNTGFEGMTTGSYTLLRGVGSRSQIHKLCLQCHAVSGSQANTNFMPHGQKAPKVHGGTAPNTSQINWDQTKDFGKIGAGGDFYMELDTNFDLTSAGSVNALGYGHSIGLGDTANPPGFTFGSPFSNGNPFSCITCHDHHGVGKGSWSGNNNFQFVRGIGINTYRNLKLYAVFLPPYYGIMSETSSWVGGITGTFGEAGSNYVPIDVNGVPVWPVYTGDSSIAANNNVYDGIGVEGMAGFCSQCHILWHEDRAPNYGEDNIAGEDWKRHPVNYVIKNSDVSGAGVSTIDWSRYNSIPQGFKVPAANTASDLTQEFYYADADNEDKVFCLSCHFAHGGPNYDNLRWDYTSAVSAGSQIGNSVASNVGCQQCHNR
jgi:hypothetical protein